jgi:hypothetical protein
MVSDFDKFFIEHYEEFLSEAKSSFITPHYEELGKNEPDPSDFA